MSSPSLPPPQRPKQVKVKQKDIISRTQLINPNNPTVGFRCDLCEATFPAYNAYLEHCNGRLHQKNIGTGPTERVDDVSRIRARLAFLREKKIRLVTTNMEDPARQVQERIAQRKLEEEEKIRKRRDNSKKKVKGLKDLTAPLLDNEDDEEANLMQTMLGISSFK